LLTPPPQGGVALPLPFGVRQLGGVRGKLPYPFQVAPKYEATWRVRGEGYYL